MDTPWRVSMRSKSEFGAAIRLVDRIEGPGQWSGEAGIEDGRIDEVLDSGSYRIELNYPVEVPSESVTVSIRPFVELGERAIPVYDEGRIDTMTLGDLEQRSFWIDVEEPDMVRIDAAGRALADMQLWLGGTWLFDIERDISTIEPSTGKPMTRIVLAGRLEPGRYLLTAYGGDPLPWASDDERFPFAIRFGMPSCNEFFSQEAAVSPFGIDYYRIPVTSNAFMLFLDEKEDFSLSAGIHEPKSPDIEFWSTEYITKDSVEPECLLEIDLRYRGDEDNGAVVGVSGEPGQRYRLLGLKADRSLTYHFHPHGTYWFYTVSAGRLSDAIDATGIVVKEGERVEKAMVIPVGNNNGWRRRFNLLETTTLFIEAKTDGIYRFETDGVPVSVVVEPFFVSKPDRYRRPAGRKTPCGWELERGYHVISFEPHRQGIIDARVYHAEDDTADMLFPPRRVSCNAGVYTIRSNGPWYHLTTNNRPGIMSGFSWRAVPIDLKEPFFFELFPGEDITIPVDNSRAAPLHLATTVPADISLSIDTVPYQSGSVMDLGPKNLTIRNDAKTPQLVTIHLNAPLDVMEPDVYREVETGLIDSLPLLTEGKPLFVELERDDEFNALARITNPGSYSIGTSGLLKTACFLRTRTKTGLLSACCNGPGRNCLIPAFLGEGIYRITTRTQGKSRGRTGIYLSRGEMTHGDTLIPGYSRSISVPAGSGLKQWIRIEEKDEYRIDVYGELGDFPCRLEDDEGWPLIRSGEPSSMTVSLLPGIYALTTYPSDVDGSRITSVRAVQKYVPLKGKGPHTLALNSREENVWMESDDDSRSPDRYVFSLPADATITIRLGERVYATLAAEGRDTPIAEVRETWTGELPSGDYRVAVHGKTRGNYQDYWIEIFCASLVDGTKKTIRAPGTVPISVGQSGLYLLQTDARRDVKAGIYSVSGDLIQQEDDCLADWNATLGVRLDRGRYRLELEPVGVSGIDVPVSMRRLNQKEYTSLDSEAEISVSIRDSLARIPLVIPGDSQMAVIHMQTDGLIGYSIIADSEVEIASGRTEGSSVLFRPHESVGCSLLIWPWGRGATWANISLRTPEIDGINMNKNDLKKTAEPVLKGDTGVAALAVSAPMPGLYSIEIRQSGASTETWSFAHHRGAALVEREPEENVIQLTPEPSIVASNVRRDKDVEFRLSRVCLEEGDSVICILRGNDPIVVDMKGEKHRGMLITAYARDGQPAVSFDENRVQAHRPLIIERNRGYDATISEDSVPVRVWSTAPREDTVLKTVIRKTGFDTDNKSLFPESGRMDIVADPDLTWALRPGERDIHIGSSSDLIAVTWGGETETVPFLLSEPECRLTLRSTASQLTLVSPRGGDVAATVEVLPAAVPLPEPFEGNGLLWEERSRSGGTTVIPLHDLKTGSTVMTHADTPGRCRYVDGAGMVRTGWRHSVRNQGGYMEISHGSGLIKSWGWEADSLASRWGPPTPVDTVSIQGSGSYPIPRDGILYSLQLDEAAGLHISTTGPYCVAISTQDEFVDVAEGIHGVRLSRWCQPGVYQIPVRAIGGLHEEGIFTVSISGSVPAYEPPFGPWLVFNPGDSRYHEFEVTEKGRIGLGVQASRDIMRCTLYSADGRVILKGVRMIPELVPGTYVLGLDAPVDQGAVRARAVITGLIPPDTGPPEDYLRQLLNRSGYRREG